jgi:8-oxo-dGTP pyrophosphatase MutT (NUDIX family)
MSQNQNPWQKQQSQPKYDNPWINVREDQVINPSGKPGIYGVVSFKNLAIGVLPIDDQGNTWLVGQYRYTLDEYSWEIPEGGCPIGREEPLETAKRELLEETGLIAQDWQYLFKMHTSNSVTDELAHVFVAQGLVQSQACPEETEQLSLWHLPFEQALEMVLEGKITDSLSVAAILHWAWRSKQAK